MNLVKMFSGFYSNNNSKGGFKNSQTTGGLKGEMMTWDERGVWMAGRRLSHGGEGRE